MYKYFNLVEHGFLFDFPMDQMALAPLFLCYSTSLLCVGQPQCRSTVRVDFPFFPRILYFNQSRASSMFYACVVYAFNWFFTRELRNRIGQQLSLLWKWYGKNGKRETTVAYVIIRSLAWPSLMRIGKQNLFLFGWKMRVWWSGENFNLSVDA